MKLSSALLLLTSAVLGVRPSSAQGEPKYFEVGTTLTLEPDVSTVQKPFNTIRWKYGNNLVVDWDSSGSTYYGSFNGRTTLDPQTLRLVINHLTLADTKQYSLETNLGTFETHEVKVIKPPPTPSIKTQPLVCNVTCALKCTADTRDLGPVSYEWKEGEGEWTEGDALKVMIESETPEKFSCRLKTRLRTSKSSDPILNPLKPTKPTKPPTISTGPTPSPWGIAVIVIIVLLVAICAALIAVVLTCPEHPFSVRLKDLIPGNKRGNVASEASNGGTAGQPNAVTGDLESGKLMMKNDVAANTEASVN